MAIFSHSLQFLSCSSSFERATGFKRPRNWQNGSTKVKVEHYDKRMIGLLCCSARLLVDDAVDLNKLEYVDESMDECVIKGEG